MNLFNMNEMCTREGLCVDGKSDDESSGGKKFGKFQQQYQQQQHNKDTPKL